MSQYIDISASDQPTIFVRREQLAHGAWQQVLPILIDLMSTVELIRSYRSKLRWKVEGRPTDPQVREFFAALHQAWPLWTHYTAQDGSLEFVIRTLCGTDTHEVDQTELREFLRSSCDAVRDIYLIYGIPDDPATLDEEVRQYLFDRGLLRHKGPPEPGCSHRSLSM